MQREIFGPILPIVPYDTLGEVIDKINASPRPLALYPFSHDRSCIDQLLEKVMSGGVSINDALFHVGQHDLPFGGVGASGMGHYHGREGFETFSKMRPVFRQARWFPPRAASSALRQAGRSFAGFPVEVIRKVPVKMFPGATRVAGVRRIPEHARIVSWIVSQTCNHDRLPTLAADALKSQFGKTQPARLPASLMAKRSKECGSGRRLQKPKSLSSRICLLCQLETEAGS